ncbi:uncharacterized protein LOC127869846 [Dreissena polymorpha]|uniref:uncharacterized protein LOC127869846 n=1 Tax=Dreissena polymorpha TaxID=45954 RepID=UPI0022649C32|nr:uncharacterized protein LOC127869846 [Dreissena polymorpha]
MGKKGLGEMNDNGERFANLCATSNLVIGGSVIHHRRIHKATWVSPDLPTENQIEHLYIAKEFRRSIQDVRVKRGADVSSIRPYHYLLVARLKMKLKKSWAEGPGQRYNTATVTLKDTTTQEEFKADLSNKLQVLEELLEEETIEQNAALPQRKISSDIKQLKNGISAGPDSIHAEAFKADVGTSVELLLPLVSKIWEEEEIPL